MNAHWISPTGKIIDVPLLHINTIIKYPELFGLTKRKIIAIHKKHRETLGGEGKAREQIMLKLIKDGWIRTRSRRNGWTVQFNKLDKQTAANIESWVHHCVDNKVFHEFMQFDLMILSKDNEVLTLEVDDIFAGQLMLRALKASPVKLKNLSKHNITEPESKDLTS